MSAVLNVVSANEKTVLLENEFSDTIRVSEVIVQLKKLYNIETWDQILISPWKIKVLMPDELFRSSYPNNELLTSYPISLVLLMKPNAKNEAFCSSHNITTLRTIKVSLITGQVATYNMETTSMLYVKCLKFQIQKALKVPLHLQQLFFDQRILKDDDVSLYELYIAQEDFEVEYISISLVVTSPNKCKVFCTYKNVHTAPPLICSEMDTLSGLKESSLVELSRITGENLTPPDTFACFYERSLTRIIDENRKVFEFKSNAVSEFHFTVKKTVSVIVRIKGVISNSATPGETRSTIEGDTTSSQDARTVFPITEPDSQTIHSVKRHLKSSQFKEYRLTLNKTMKSESGFNLGTKLEVVGKVDIVFDAALLLVEKKGCLLS